MLLLLMSRYCIRVLTFSFVLFVHLSFLLVRIILDAQFLESIKFHGSYLGTLFAHFGSSV